MKRLNVLGIKDAKDLVEDHCRNHDNTWSPLMMIKLLRDKAAYYYNLGFQDARDAISEQTQLDRIEAKLDEILRSK